MNKVDAPNQTLLLQLDETDEISYSILTAFYDHRYGMLKVGRRIIMLDTSLTYY